MGHLLDGHFHDINEAVKAVRAADRLDIPFVMHVREPDTEGEPIEYVVVLLSPGTRFEVPDDYGGD